MNCKTCDNPIDAKAKFCSNCGSKIVTDRLSFKGTWEEFVGPFFSWDNNFWRTFFGLFRNPKEVLEAYISGARKKYFQPFSYIILFATIAVFFYKFFPMEITDDMATNFAEGNKMGTSSGEKFAFDMKAYNDFTMNYYNFMLLTFLPFYALISFFVFRKRGHNFFEHLVFNCYTQTNLGYVTLLLQLILLHIFDFSFITFSYIIYLLMILFSLYVFKKLYQLNFKQTIFSFLRFVLFLFLFLVLLMMIGLIIGIIFFLVSKTQ